ncbi:hypothetical protein T03_14285 [Trichinella britovi]|uniref:Uncharacterized protein n=1 Tax=Trichinella britovi TaxID=45882 RepID=A0A0V0ZCZ9_TRIBR|nr:hypothetical protein T03_14285 [Trichinella britovi]
MNPQVEDSHPFPLIVSELASGHEKNVFPSPPAKTGWRSQLVPEMEAARKLSLSFWGSFARFSISLIIHR